MRLLSICLIGRLLCPLRTDHFFYSYGLQGMKKEKNGIFSFSNPLLNQRTIQNNKQSDYSALISTEKDWISNGLFSIDEKLQL